MNPLIRKLERFTRLSDADKRLLQQAASARIVNYDTHQDIIAEGEEPCDVNLILAGWVCRYKQLADGSRIDLNAATRIDVSWHLRSRRVVLHDGQALFAVAPASYRPFEVQAGDTHIRVVGTVFDVRKNADTVVVSVLEGRVRVGTSQRTPTLLGAAEGIASVHGELGPARHIDPQAATAWRSGRLVFERTPLAEALRDIQRYRDAPIRLHGERLAGLELSGVFDSARIDQLLDLLPTVLPLSLTRQPDGSVDLAAR